MRRSLKFAAPVAVLMLTAGIWFPAHSQQRSQKPAPASQTKASAPAANAGNQPATETRGEAAQKPLSPDEAAIHARIEAFATAYNAGDAAAIAALFAPDGEIITDDGRTIEGREAIEQGFRELFEDLPQLQMEVDVESIRLLGAEIALEIGVTREYPAPGEAPEYGRYTALHIKRNGEWLLMAVRDTPADPPTSQERLLPLAWMVGEWIDDGGSTVIHTNCRWSDDGNYLLSDIKVQISGRDALEMTQRIGWDPLMKRIRSWTFDTEGGFAEGVWSRDGDSWVVKSTGVRAEGLAASATSVIVPAGSDGYVLRMHDRVIGDEVQPAIEARVVRKPPTPE